MTFPTKCQSLNIDQCIDAFVTVQSIEPLNLHAPHVNAWAEGSQTPQTDPSLLLGLQSNLRKTIMPTSLLMPFFLCPPEPQFPLWALLSCPFQASIPPPFYQTTSTPELLRTILRIFTPRTPRSSLPPALLCHPQSFDNRTSGPQFQHGHRKSFSSDPTIPCSPQNYYSCCCLHFFNDVRALKALNLASIIKIVYNRFINTDLGWCLSIGLMRLQ